MLTLTTPDGTTITAKTDVQLADKWGALQYGDYWHNLAPFDEHTAMNEALEELALMREGTFPNYTITES